jgi:ferritin-like metal-binding protein YciE
MSEKIQNSIGPLKKQDHASTGTQRLKTEREALIQIFEELINDVYSAEQLLVKALPDLTKAVCSEELQDALEDHFQQTKCHVQRLEKIMESVRISKKNETCKTMKGLIEEKQRIIREYAKGSTRDVALIVAAQTAEGYEIAAYNLLVELADALGMDTITDLLKRSLDEEKETDELLSDIAQDINDEVYACVETEFDYA